MYQSNENCSLCNQCDNIKGSINASLINIADADLYNTRYELNREVDFKKYYLLKYYKRFVHDICLGENCDFCYGGIPENILERARIISVL